MLTSLSTSKLSTQVVQKIRNIGISYYHFLGELTSQVEDSIAEKKLVPGIKTLNNPYVSGTIKRREEEEQKKSYKIGAQKDTKNCAHNYHDTTNNMK